MKIFERGKKLLHDKCSNLFGQKLVLNDVLEKFPTLTILQDQETHFVPFPNFIKLNDIRMVKVLQNFDFIDECVEIFYFFLLDCLHSKQLLSLSVLSLVYDTKST